MRMAIGGVSPGYNVQFATDAAQGVIVGVRVTNHRSDSGQAPPMLEQIAQQTGRRPTDYLVDAAYTDKASVGALDAMGVTLYGSVVERCGKDPFKPQRTDSAAVSALRTRMGSPTRHAPISGSRPRAVPAARGRARLSRSGASGRSRRRRSTSARPPVRERRCR